MTIEGEIPEDVRETAWLVLNNAGWAFLRLGYDPSTVIAQAILAERERCAKVADEYQEIWARPTPDPDALVRSRSGMEIAMAIREGSRRDRPQD